MLCDLYLTRMQPFRAMNIQRAAQVVTQLDGRTEDPRYFLMRAEVYRTAWASDQKLRSHCKTLDGVANNSLQT